jgi:hypothetical protein
MTAQKIKLQNQILIVNVAILAGLAFEYFRGITVGILVLCGVFLLPLANIIFFIRLGKLRTTL